MTGTKISIRTGSEGPRHDPYGYTEITVERNDCVFTLHGGLWDWLDVTEDGGDTVRHVGPDSAEIFEQLTGMSPAQAEKYEREAKNRCPDCGKTRVVILGTGYAGEAMYGCTKCERILYDDFHISMIE